MFNSKVRSLTLLLSALAVTTLSCAELFPPPSADHIASLPRQSGWQVHASNPIISLGDLRDKGVWNDPCVLKQDSTYVMYLTSTTGEVFNSPVQPFRAVSSDGIQWTLQPSQPLLDPAGTPYKSLETPSVVFYKNAYHMYYSGIFPEGTVPSMAIGHATSPDGITWTKDPRAPAVLSATGNVSDWNGYLVAEPGAVVYKDRIYLYFTAMGARPGGTPPQKQVVGLATSTDGSRFDKPRIVLEQSDLYPADRGFVGYSTPAAAVHEGNVHIFCDVAYFNKDDDPQWSQVALHHAVSDDGEHGFRQDPAAIVTRQDFAWANGEISGPCVLFDGETIKMWFLGHARAHAFMPEVIATNKTRNFGIAYATTAASRYASEQRPGTQRQGD